AHYGKSPDLAIVEDRGGGLDTEHGTDDEGRVRHHVADGGPDDPPVLSGESFPVLEEQSPPGRDLRAPLAPDQIAVTDDAHDVPAGVHDRQSADPVREHQPCSFLNRRLWTNRDHPAGHDVFDGHARPPASATCCPDASWLLCCAS